MSVALRRSRQLVGQGRRAFAKLKKTRRLLQFFRYSDVVHKEKFAQLPRRRANRSARATSITKRKIERDDAARRRRIVA